ncbi:response regulator receiver modulated diguanylate cyclase/phosphodiesterase [Luteimonas cucumeris]|uniref:Response regulator receiver modulated diguanylate cyclase/phosphodiesterase n=1 Tax=Luteimonas cucumeris TaxID=985012 RepID=A0A562L5N6_9GAMM|nr:EAL domain-containing protein [Luteimonas cucumeris]TWI02826.1 response regulator receiver modulated diguanylate cyclase/phosphodiesterase [Luteimonas cucumeris]
MNAAPPSHAITRLGASEPELARLIDAANSDGPPLMLLHIDIDHFRSVNENMGAEIGDQALIMLGERLAAKFGPDAHIWASGSDEFLVALPLLPGNPSPEQYGELARSQVELPMLILPFTLFLTGTVGIALCPEHARTASALLHCAEYAVAQAKLEGLNLVRRYTRGAAISLRNDGIIAREIVSAVDNGELRLCYQPQVSAGDGRVIGMEALLRWQSPTLGTLIPERFMRTAEKLGVITQIGDWVLRNVCQQARIWRDWGYPDLEIAVNISTLQLQRPTFAMEVVEAIQAAGIPSGMIVLEIRQSALAMDMNFVHQTLANLHREGIRLTLDDFGMGDSSLDSLIRFSVDKIKIDRNFVKGLPAGSREVAITCAIIAMGHQLGMKVVAHGVETETQLGFLRRNQCDIFQGHLFGHPMAADEAGEVLRRRFVRSDAFIATQPDRTLLLVDDEENILRSLVRLFRRDGYRVLAASTVADAFDLLATNDVQVILSDQRMSDMSGTEFLGRVKVLYPDTMRLVLSGYTDLATVTDAINRGAIYRFLTKPWDDNDLREHIRQAFHTYAEQHSRIAG